MPLIKIDCTEEKRAWGFWRISETEEELAQQVSDYEIISPSITNPDKRLEFYAGRVLTKHLCESLDFPFQGIQKDGYGKPTLKNYRVHLSLSHSFPYVAAIIDLHQPVGIDLEQPKEKLLRVAHRIMSPTEFENAGEDITKHCIFWCAKEALVKIHGKKDLIFSEHLEIAPFRMENEGFIIGNIIANNKKATIKLKYAIHRDFVVVYNE